MFTPNEKPESYSLNVHFNGLSYLYSFVKSEEERILRERPRTVFFTDFGSSDIGDIILNHFIWYSNSFLPFVDLFSRAYALPQEKLRLEFRAVKKWRDKVAAHFSLVNPGSKRALKCTACGALVRREHNGDSRSVQGASANQYLSWSNGRFSVGRQVFSNVDTGDSTPDDWGWELTEVHERALAVLKRHTRP